VCVRLVVPGRAHIWNSSPAPENNKRLLLLRLLLWFLGCCGWTEVIPSAVKRQMQTRELYCTRICTATRKAGNLKKIHLGASSIKNESKVRIDFFYKMDGKFANFFSEGLMIILVYSPSHLVNATWETIPFFFVWKPDRR
jgi:hypothetical protein